MEETPKIFYRFQPGLWLDKFYLEKETSKGYWIVSENPDSIYKHEHAIKWVSKRSKKRFAYPTKKEALNNFIARKYREIKIYEQRIKNAVEQQKEAKKKLQKELRK